MKVIKKHKKIIIISIIVFFLVSAIIGFSYASFTTDSSKTGSVQTISNTFCIDNEIYKLNDCIKAQNANTTNIQTAESIIEAKTYDTTKIAPLTVSSIYEKKVKANVRMTNAPTYYSSLDTQVVYSNSEPVFNASTGKYSFIYDGKKTVSEILEDTNNGHPKYLCNTTLERDTTCNYIYVLNNVTKQSDTRYDLTDVDLFTSKSTMVLTGDSGLYAADDYNNTKTYFFRGKVDNNYVRFAGYNYKIIRINGDGSIRMIYANSSLPSNLRNKNFNANKDKPYYSFYMYGDDKTYLSFSSTHSSPTSRYFFDNYNSETESYDDEPCTYDTNTNEAICTLKGRYINTSYSAKYAQLKAGYDGDGLHPYKYACLNGSFNSSTQTFSCDVYFIVDFDDSRNTQRVSLFYITTNGYVVTENEQRSNKKDSNAKAALDSWYQANILNKTSAYGNSYDTYVADSIFCADRTYASNSPYKGVGDYMYDKNIYYGQNSFMCTDARDRFTVNVTDQNRGIEGNDALTYKVGLITYADAKYAGITSTSNTNNYLYFYNYTNHYTMSPAYYMNLSGGTSYINSIYSGYLTGRTLVDNGAFRPVINLDKDTYITGGSGTSTSPYEIISKQEYDALNNN